MNIGNEIDKILADFKSITLEKIQQGSLLRRKDRKYMFRIEALPEILKQVSGDYQVLEIHNKRTQIYRTYYYDTPELEMYHKHHRGMANRHKIRFREYTTSDEIFLEVKKKNAKGITNKKRIKTLEMDHSTLVKETGFLEVYTPYKPDGIAFTLENGFNRITLVNPSQTERITLDYQLRFSGNGAGGELAYPGVSIAEIKFEKHLSGSPFHNTLRKFRITSKRFSKYAIGMALVHPDLKQNRFRDRVRSLHMINNQYNPQTKQPNHA